MSLHTFCHVEWAVTNLIRAKSFYGSLFNWKFESFGDEYVMINTPSEEVGGGLMLQKEVNAGSSPTVYVEVASVEEHLGKAAALGAKVCMPKTEIPGIGWFGIVQDPDNNAIGIYESINGLGDRAAHTFCHVDWSVKNAEKAKAFFGGLFDWKFEPFGESYHMFRTPSENMGGGIMQEPNVQPAQSPCIYVMVNSIEPYLTKAEKVGGSVAMGKTEIPGMGWFAILLDPDRNAVGIYESARKE